MTTRPTGARRLLAIDGLRLLCAVAVAGYHYGVAWRVDSVHPPLYFLPHAAPVLAYGFLGVEVFFLISGFVIGMSSWGRGLRAFLVSRFTRLYPAFWVCLAITVAVLLLLPLKTGVPYGDSLTLKDFVYNLTLAPQPLGANMADTVYWTLWAEIRFYLVFAVLVATGGLTYRKVVLFCAGWLALAAFAPALWPELTMPDYAPYFAGGVAIYLMHRFRPNLVLWLLVGSSWLLAMQRVAVRIAGQNPGFHQPVWPARLIVTAAFAILIAIALGWTERANWPWLRTAGALTYPFYLLHQRLGHTFMRQVWNVVHLPMWLMMTLATGFVLGVAWLVHRYAEQPITAFLRSRLSPRKPAPAETVHSEDPELVGVVAQRVPGQGTVSSPSRQR